MNLCTHGHDKDTVGYTRSQGCKACSNLAQLERRKARYAARRAAQTHCPEGHELTEDNRYIPNGWASFRCKLCRARSLEAQRKLRAELNRQAREEAKRQAMLDGWEDEFGPIEPLPDGYVDPVQEARDRVLEPPRRQERPLRPISGVYGQVGSSVRGPGSHTSFKARRRAVYGFIGS